MKTFYIVSILTLTLLAIAAAPATIPATQSAGGTLTPYTDPAQQTSVPFGSKSWWAQPWRAYLQTVPASIFLNGLSLNYSSSKHTSPDLICQHLSKYGIKRIRTEFGWGSFSYADESKPASKDFAPILAACAKWKMRPLILLNSNSGLPCPSVSIAHKVIAAAPVGTTSLTLDSATGITPGYSGLGGTNPLIASISGNTVKLTKPTTSAIAANSTITITTFKYRPFNAVGTADYNATLAGWTKYVNSVCTMATVALGPGNFDVECWNELSFAWEFLLLSNYDSTVALNGDHWTAIRQGILAATANAVKANFPGVKVGDGFANQTPFAAMSTEPAGVDAIDKHPYPRLTTFPENPPTNHANALDALGNADASGWQPVMGCNFIEYCATAIQTEFLERSMGPIGDNIYGTVHAPNTPLWITEINQRPNWNLPEMDAATARYLKAKIGLRGFTFFLNKGASFVDFYDATEGDLNFGMVADSFVALAAVRGATYPADDRSVTSPFLQAVGHVVAKFSSGIDSSITPAGTRKISLDSISDTHNNVQFSGDGTPQHPPLYDRQVFAFLPYQINATTFAIPYYVMTRNITRVYSPNGTGGHQYDMPPEQFTLTLSGLAGQGATVIAYDPINNINVPLAVLAGTAKSLQVTVPATDYPYLLLVTEHPPVSIGHSRDGINWTVDATIQP